jgi:hypothetical protein
MYVTVKFKPFTRTGSSVLTACLERLKINFSAFEAGAEKMCFLVFRIPHAHDGQSPKPQ